LRIGCEQSAERRERVAENYPVILRMGFKKSKKQAQGDEDAVFFCICFGCGAAPGKGMSNVVLPGPKSGTLRQAQGRLWGTLILVI